jgi:hypothetical protein
MPKVQKCTRGHTQTPAWKRHHGCSTCRKQDAIAEAAMLALSAEAKLLAKREREEAAAQLRPLPDPYHLRDHSGRIVGTFRAGGRRRRRRA